MKVPPFAKLGPAELTASLDAALAAWDGHSPLWVFGYGSLTWKPELEFDLRVPARVFGYHRRLCLRSIRYRGSFDCPGIVAGLDRGGCCAGLAYRVRPEKLRAQFEQLWEREMFMGSYDARWLRAKRLDENERLDAIAFVVRHDAPNYAGRLGEAELIDILTRACGHYGTSLDYLVRTVESLRAHGVPDPHLERLAQKAQHLMAQCAPAGPQAVAAS
jgi:glutathione-specific gamma-glutamylcyclotransferase